MSEVSSVSNLVSILLAFALTAGAAGTLVDLHRQAKINGAHAVRIGLMSYGRWNRQLLHAPRARSIAWPITEKRKSQPSKPTP